MPIPFANVLQPLIDAFEQVIIFFHDEAGFGWGLSIVVLTVAVRLVLLPLTVRQFKSMRKMQQLAPQIKALQAKYKDDKQRQQQEMMRFYQEHKVNPFASCLPLVAQLPVFLGLYYMLRKDLKENICPQIVDVVREHSLSLSDTSCHQISAITHGAVSSHGAEQFLFIPDLTAKATGGVLVALIILYVGTQLASSLLSPVTDRNQRLIMMALPVVFVAFIIRFPTGLIVYWITTNAWTAAQQIIIRRGAGSLPPATAGAGSPAGATAAVSGNGSEDGGGGGLLGSLGLGRKKDEPEPAAVGGGRSKSRAAGGGSGGSAPRTKAPPPSPRKKKKRSGRRR